MGVIVMPSLQGHGGVKHIQEMVAALMFTVMTLAIICYLFISWFWIKHKWWVLWYGTESEA